MGVCCRYFLYNVWRCFAIIIISLITGICEESDDDTDDGDGVDDDVSYLTPQHWRLAREEALE